MSTRGRSLSVDISTEYTGWANLKWYACKKMNVELVVILAQCRYTQTAQRIFKYSDIQYTSLTLNKNLNSLIYRMLFYVNIYGSCKLLKQSVFWPTLYICMSHKSIMRHLFCCILTKIQLNSEYIYVVRNLHFADTKPYDNYTTTSAGSKSAKIGECEATPTAAPQPMSTYDLENRICVHWHNLMSHCDIRLCQYKLSRTVEYLIIANSTWLNLDH